MEDLKTLKKENYILAKKDDKRRMFAMKRKTEKEKTERHWKWYASLLLYYKANQTRK